MECRNCGFRPPNRTEDVCRKCDTPFRGEIVDDLYVVDVAHDGETVDEAIGKTTRAVSDALLLSFKGVKIIHGYGSGKGYPARISAAVRPLLEQLARDHSADLVQDRHTRGAQILYFQRKPSKRR